MKRASYTNLKSWHKASILLVGALVLFAGISWASIPFYGEVMHTESTATTLDLPETPDGVNEFTMSAPDVPVSAYCARPTTHFGGNAPSAILLTIANLDANSIYVEIQSGTASPVDLLLIENIVGGTVSDMLMPSPGVIRRTVTWANPPSDVILNVLWSHEDFGGNWQLSQAPISVPFNAVCDGSPPPASQPTSNASTPTCPASEVISIYGSTYTSIATNFDPNWASSGIHPYFSVS